MGFKATKKRIAIVGVVAILVVVVLVGSIALPQYINRTNSSSSTKTIVDMYGRTLTVPTTITRVLCTSPIDMQIVYMIAPDKLVGLPFAYNGNPAYVPTKYADITIIGGWFGQQTGNIETFLTQNPDIILDGTDESIEALEARQQQFGSIPVIGVNAGDFLTRPLAKLFSVVVTDTTY